MKLQGLSRNYGGHNADDAEKANGAVRKGPSAADREDWKVHKKKAEFEGGLSAQMCTERLARDANSQLAH